MKMGGGGIGGFSGGVVKEREREREKEENTTRCMFILTVSPLSRDTNYEGGVGTEEAAAAAIRGGRHSCVDKHPILLSIYPSAAAKEVPS